MGRLFLEKENLFGGVYENQSQFRSNQSTFISPHSCR